MGVLDDLKREADAIAEEKARESTSRESARKEARVRLEPTMQALFQYFSQFTQHLQAIQREITADYEIRGAGLVKGLVQGQYGVATEHKDRIDKFLFRCACSKEGTLQVQQDDPAAAAGYRDWLRENGLQAKVRDAGRGRSVFMVQPVVPVVVQFAVDPEREEIKLRARNLETIGVLRHRLRPDQVDEKLMDELAKVLLRQPNRFAVTLGISLTDTGKLRLKKKIRAAMRQKEIEDEMERKKIDEERTITRRLGTLFGRRED